MIVFALTIAEVVAGKVGIKCECPETLATPLEKQVAKVFMGNFNNLAGRHGNVRIRVSSPWSTFHKYRKKPMKL
jgi:hypothetical protein